MKSHFIALAVCLSSLLSPACNPYKARNETTVEMNHLPVAIRMYDSEFGLLDLTSPPKVFTALHKGNRKMLNFIEPREDEKKAGVFLDGWGTEFRFRRIDEKNIEITSAGPDRKFSTEDDVIR